MEFHIFRKIHFQMAIIEFNKLPREFYFFFVYFIFKSSLGMKTYNWNTIQN